MQKLPPKLRLWLIPFWGVGTLVYCWYFFGWTAVIAAVAVVCVGVAVGIKAKLLRAYPVEVQLERAQASDFPAMDAAAWQNATAALEALGFVARLDYTVRAGAGQMVPNLWRLFWHEGHHCYALCFQHFVPDRPASTVACLIASNLTEPGHDLMAAFEVQQQARQQSLHAADALAPLPSPQPVAFEETADAKLWSLMTTNAAPQGLSYLLRRSQALLLHYPGAAPSDLLREHLAWRERVRQDLGLVVVGKLPIEAHFALSQRGYRLARRNLARRNSFIVLWELLFVGSRVTRWLGDYPNIAAQRRTSGEIP